MIVAIGQNIGQSAPSPADPLHEAIARVAGMTIDALRKEWRTVFSTDPPPAFSKDLLARAITYRMQEEAFGGISPSTARYLRTLQKPGMEPPRLVQVGSVIIREHKGVIHEVLVIPGGFCWQGKTYSSLSIIAKAITGITWNGPRFFGLRSKRDAEGDHIEDGVSGRGSAQPPKTVPPARTRGRRSSIATEAPGSSRIGSAQSGPRP